MATIRLIPSTYELSDTQYLSISNANNMYANTDSTNYATITNNRNSTTSYYLYLRGFNFNDIPSNALVNSFTIKLKAREAGISTSDSYKPYLANGTNAINGSCPVINTNEQTLTFNGLSANWETISGYGSNFGIRINCRRASRNTVGTMYIYGAEIEVDYTLPTYHQITSSNNTDLVDSIVPSGTTSVLEGENYTLNIYTNSIGNIKVEDNGTDVSNQLVRKENQQSDTASTVLGTYTLVSGGFNSGESYFQGLVGKGVNNTQTTSNYYSSGSGTIAVFTYNLTFNDIPSNATITRVYVEVNGHAESTSSDSEYMCVQLRSGDSELSSELNFKTVGTSNSTQTVEATTIPTLAQLSNLTLYCRLGYYGGAINGATCYVEYTTPSQGYYWEYSLTNVNADHTITVETGIPTYSVNASSTYTGATIVANPTTVQEGSNCVLTLTTQYITKVKVEDNGNDITSQFTTGSNNTYTYTLTNVTTAHTVIVSELTKTLYMNVENVMKTVNSIQKKVDGGWTTIPMIDFWRKVNGNYANDTTVSGKTSLVYGGMIETIVYDEIGTVNKSTSDLTITINDNALQSGTYKMFYEDINRSIIDRIDEITEFTI